MFAILPRVTWAGVEARSLCVHGGRRGLVDRVAGYRRYGETGGWLWLLYALALMLSILLNLYLVLLVPVYAVVTPVLAAP